MPIVSRPAKHDKHTEVTAASFKRLAKAVRKIARRTAAWPTMRQGFVEFADALDAEAAKLRAMR